MIPALDLPLLATQPESLVEVIAQASTVRLSTVIAVFYLNPKISIAMASKPELQTIADQITAISLQESAQLLIADNLQPHLEISEGSYSEYFNSNAGNPLVEKERELLLAEGYDLSDGTWIALPFLSNENTKGIFFISPKYSQEYRKIKNKLNNICKKS